MRAEQAFEHRAAQLREALAQARDAKEAAGACVLAIEQTACELAQDEQDEIARQRQQAVLALLKRAPQLLVCTGAKGRLVVREGQTDEQKMTLGAQAVGGAILAVLAVAGLVDGEVVFALLQALGGVLLFFGGRRLAERTQDVAAEGEWAIDANATVSRIGELMRAADICAGDLALLTQDMGGSFTGDADEATLDLLVSLMEARASGSEAAMLRSMNQVEQHLHALGSEVLHYNEENDALFDKLPTLGQARTVRPALMKDGKVVRRGVAAVKEVTLP